MVVVDAVVVVVSSSVVRNDAKDCKKDNERKQEFVWVFVLRGKKMMGANIFRCEYFCALQQGVRDKRAESKKEGKAQERERERERKWKMR